MRVPAKSMVFQRAVTLSHRSRPVKNPHEGYQALTPAAEGALEKWALRMDDLQDWIYPRLWQKSRYKRKNAMVLFVVNYIRDPSESCMAAAGR